MMVSVYPTVPSLLFLPTAMPLLIKISSAQLPALVVAFHHGPQNLCLSHRSARGDDDSPRHPRRRDGKHKLETRCKAKDEMYYIPVLYVQLLSDMWCLPVDGNVRVRFCSDGDDTNGKAGQEEGHAVGAAVEWNAIYGFGRVDLELRVVIVLLVTGRVAPESNGGCS